MRKLIFFLLLIIPITAFSQVHIGKKVQRSDFVGNTSGMNYISTGDIAAVSSINELRIVYGFNATSINLKTGKISAINSTGIGLANITHKLNDKGEVYKSWLYGGMIQLGTSDQSPLINDDVIDKNLAVGFMVFGGLGPVTMGPSYFPAPKALLLNLNVDFSF